MNIYELLQAIIPVEKYGLSASLFDEDKKKLLETDNNKKLFDILKNISSLATKKSNKGFVFCPALVMSDGTRLFAVEDLTEEDLAHLNTLDLQQIPLNLRARICDVLWSQAKDYKAACYAADAHLELFNLWFSDEEWVGILEEIEHAICISMQIKNIPLYEKCCDIIYNHIVRIDANDESFLSIRLLDILLEHTSGEPEIIIEILEKIITKSENNPAKTERAFKLKTKFLIKFKNTEAATKTNVELADYFVTHAEKIYGASIHDSMRATHFYQDAITLYRNNKEPLKAEKSHRRLIEIQKHIPETMTRISIPFDATKIINAINTNMEGLSLEESIITLSRFVAFQKREDTKKQLISNMKENPLSYLVGTSTINLEGQTISILPPLDMNDPESDEKLLDLHIFKEMFSIQEIAGSTYLKYALSLINDKFSIKKEDLAFLAKDNIIIPEGRQNIILSALHLALTGQYYEALHILAPQVESFFRNIAKEVGGITVTLGENGISDAKVLSSIFNLPELLDCYDNDILFFFRGMLHERTGANIRNNIAHGIMNETTATNGASVYFICAVIKLIVYSSPVCYLIAKKSKKLKTQISIKEDSTTTSTDVTKIKIAKQKSQENQD